MDNINIYEADGTLWANIKVSADCYYRNALEGDESVELRWEAYDYAKIPVGSYVNIEGRVYRLTEPHEPTRRTESIYTFAPVFYSQTYHWKKAMACLYEYGSAVTYTDTNNTISATIPEPTSRELDWSFTGNLPDALFMLIQMIKNETGVVWNAHYAAEVADKLIEYTSQGSSIFDFIAKIAEQCGKEFHFDYSGATPVVNIGTLEIEAQGTHTSEGRVLLNVGEDVSNPSVQSEAEEYFTRFYFFGSTRNIVQPNSITKSSVVNRRLPLCPSKVTTSGYTDMNYYPKGFIDIDRKPSSYTDREYIPDLPPYKVFAKSVFFDDIYPHSDLKIQSVQTRHIAVIDDAGAETGEQMPIYYVKLVNKNGTAFNFNSGTYPNGDMLPTLVPSIAFRSGYLQGLEYELIYHATDFTVNTTGSEGQGGRVTIQAPCFEIVFDTNSNPRLPNDNIKPQANDECTLFNIHMPQEYIWNAQKELEQKAIEFINDLNVDKSTYELNSNPIAFESFVALGNLQVGSLVKMVYPNGETIKSRVISIERHLDIPYDCKVTLGYSARQGTIQTLRQVIEDTSVNVESVVKEGDKTKAQLLGLKNGYLAQKEVFDSTFDADGNFDGSRIKPLTVETKALSVGSRSQQFTLSGVQLSVAKYTTGNGTLSWDCTNGKLAHLSLDEDYILVWPMATGTQALNDANSHYIYAKVAKDGFGAASGGIKTNSNSGTFVATAEQKKFDSDQNYYYFLVGTISSAQTDAATTYKSRIISLTYGTTTINGKQIQTGVIRSSDGQKVIINLDDGTITGDIRFQSGTQGLSDLNNIIGNNTTVVGAVNTANTANTNASNAVSTANTANDTANRAEGKIDGLEIGGRNLLRNTASMLIEPNGMAGWRASGGTVTNVTIVNKPISSLSGAVRCTNNGGSITTIGIAQDYTNNSDRFKFKVGESYAQSYYIRGHLSFYDSLPSDIRKGGVNYSYDETTDTYTLTSTYSGDVNTQLHLANAMREANYRYLAGKYVTISVDITSSNTNNKPRLYVYDLTTGASLISWNLHQGHNETSLTFPTIDAGHTVGLILRMHQYQMSGSIAVGDTCTFKNLIIKQESTYNYPQPIWGTNASYLIAYGVYIYPTHEWQRVEFAGKLTGSQLSAYSAGYSCCQNAPVGGWFEICAEKLENATKATDWSPAPEDVDAGISTAQTAAASAQQAATNAQTTINNMDSDSYFSTVEKKSFRPEWKAICGVDNTTTTPTASSTYGGSYEQALKAAQGTTVSTTALTTAFGNLRGHLNTYKLYTSENTNWGTSGQSTLATYVKAYYNAEQAFYDALADYWSEVKSQQAVSNLQIGGRNLLLGSNKEVSGNGNWYLDYAQTIEADSTLTVSFDIDAENVVWSTSGTYHRAGIEIAIPKPSGGYQYYGLWWTGSGTYKSRLNATAAIVNTLTPPHNPMFGIYIQNLGSGTIKLKNFKLEKGNKATDWSPAPEDGDPTARAAAQAAQDRLTNIDSNSVFSMAEKQAFRTEWYAISGIADTVSAMQQGGSAYTHYHSISSAADNTLGALNTAFSKLRLYLKAFELYTNSDRSTAATTETYNGTTVVTAGTAFSKTTLSQFLAAYYKAELDVEFYAENVGNLTGKMTSGYAGTNKRIECDNTDISSTMLADMLADPNMRMKVVTNYDNTADNIYFTFRNDGGATPTGIKPSGVSSDQCPLKFGGTTSNKCYWLSGMPFELKVSSKSSTAVTYEMSDEANVQTVLAFSKAMKGTTSVQGGLILTETIVAGSGTGQAGMSGENAGGSVAFWAGGTIGQAMQWGTPVVIMRDGNAKFGILRISKDGKLYFQSGNTERFVIQNSGVALESGNKVYNVGNETDNNTWQNLGSVSQTTISGTSYASPTTVTIVSTQAMNNATAYVYYPNVDIFVQVQGTLNVHTSGQGGEVSIYVEFTNNTTWTTALMITKKIQPNISGATIEIPLTESSGVYNAVSLPSSTGYKSPIGLRVLAFKTGSITNVSFVLDSVKWHYFRDLSKAKTVIGNNGIGILLNSNNLFKVVGNSADTELATTIKGKTSIPGVLWAGYITSSGSVYTYYANGEKYSSSVALECSTYQSNRYMITHKLGTQNFSAIATPQGSTTGRTLSITIPTSGGIFYVYASAQTGFMLTIYGVI